jgi:hypothetical protein
MQRTPVSSAAPSMASPSAWYMARVNAFFFSGRLSVKVSTPFATSLRTWSVIESSSHRT